jgi:ADP-ribose diphosphatase
MYDYESIFFLVGSIMVISKSKKKYVKLPEHLTDEQILFEGRTFEIVNQFWKYYTNNGIKISKREIARRTPGVRVILNDGDKILVIKEYRTEYDDWDYRLPGGKIFDTLDEYKEKLNVGADFMPFALSVAKKELLEETGLIADDIKFLYKSKAGATVVWDLYYFEVNNFEISTSNLEFDEIILNYWNDILQVKQMCMDGRIKEDRTVGILLKYIMNKGL